MDHIQGAQAALEAAFKDKMKVIWYVRNMTRGVGDVPCMPRACWPANQIAHYEPKSQVQYFGNLSESNIGCTVFLWSFHSAAPLSSRHAKYDRSSSLTTLCRSLAQALTFCFVISAIVAASETSDNALGFVEVRASGLNGPVLRAHGQQS